MPAPRPVRFLGSVVAWFGHAGTFILVSLLAGGLFAGLLIPFAAGVGIAARNGAESFQDIEVDALVVGELPGRTTMLSADGQTIATFYRENRSERTLEQISPLAQQALLAIEDRRFYEHGPVDLRGILRALVTNLQAGEVEEGASTLTMQYARNLLVIEAGDDEQALAAALARTTERKIAEIKYAIALEDEYTKDDILQAYLNTVFFGNRSYGIEVAARNYFSVTAAELTLPQAATLAGLVQDPNGLDPTRNLAGATARRNVVLDSMVVAGFVTEQEATAAKVAPMALAVPPSRNGCLVAGRAARFCDYAYNWLLARPELGATLEERQNLLQTGGLTITTTMNPFAQAAAQDAIAAYVEPTNPVSAASAVVQPGTGQVLAVATAEALGENIAAGQSTVNYAVDMEYGQSAGFQAGSTFKIFTLTAAMQEGLSLYDRFPGSQTAYDGFRNCETGVEYPPPYYEPANSTGSTPGSITILEATARSVNSAFVGLEEQITQCAAATMAERLGMLRSDGNPLLREPSFTLGTDEVSPLRMAESVATLAARGLHCTSYPITEVVDRDGTVLLAQEPACEQVIDPRWADAASYALQGVMRSGGTGAGVALDRPSAGKTGTTNDNIAVWFTGYTPNLAAAVWVGNPDSNQYPLENVRLKDVFYPEVFGGRVPGPIWQLTMQNTLNGMGLPPAAFAEPPPESLLGRPVNVPSVLGRSLPDATNILEGAGFRVAVSPGREFSDYPRDTVARTSPGGGSSVTAGSTITLYLSGGPQGGGGGEPPPPGGGNPCPPRALICPPGR